MGRYQLKCAGKVRLFCENSGVKCEKAAKHNFPSFAIEGYKEGFGFIC